MACFEHVTTDSKDISRCKHNRGCPQLTGVTTFSTVNSLDKMEKHSLFVAISKFAVANGMTQQVKEAFIARPHMVDSADGFVRLDVISPLESPDEIWLLTYWRDQDSFKAWHKSHTYRDSHKGIPKGLKLNPSATEIRFFEHIAS